MPQLSAIISGCVSPRFALFELMRKPTLIRAGILILNALVVAYLVYVRFSRTATWQRTRYTRRPRAKETRKEEGPTGAQREGPPSP